MGVLPLRVSAFEVPTDLPEADGTLAWSSTVLVTVEVGDGPHGGFGYTYADRATACFIAEHLFAIAGESDPIAVDATFAAMGRAVRNVGRDGVAATAIAAVDMACWDRKAKLLKLSLAELMGVRRREVPAYRSGGFTSYSFDQLRRWLEGSGDEGFTRVKIKIGGGAETLGRVRMARKFLGAGADLFVDANGAFDRRGAVRMAAELGSYGVTWFEEPVSSDDLTGLRFVRERTPAGVAVAAGEYGYRSLYFDRMLEASAVDVLQADATRCGVTGFVAAATLCDARKTPLSAHCAPAVHAQLGCALEPLVHVEHFHDHARIERLLFDGAPPVSHGSLQPDLTRPGIGVTLKRADAEPFLVYEDRVGTWNAGAR